jgi:hypothetical protein
MGAQRAAVAEVGTPRISTSKGAKSAMHDLSAQLEMFGLDGARRLAEGATTSARERSRLLRRIDVTHELMSELPAGEDLSFLHSGLCQTCLPHSRLR